MAKQPLKIDVKLDDIFLDLNNPRHEPFKNQGETIEYLSRDEYIIPLAKDIVKNGLNPLELIAIIPDNTGLDNGKKTYFVADGNRRICALKLLHDPELAPHKNRRSFEEAAKNWAGIPDLPCVLFENRGAVKPWLDRTHGGEKGGIGPRKWNADQIARHSGNKRNQFALEFLDYAELHKLITSDKRERKLTTVGRYLSNKRVRDAMGIHLGDRNELMRTRPKKDFHLLLEKFLDDLLAGRIHSRSTTDDQEAYAMELLGVQGGSDKKVQPTPLAAPKRSDEEIKSKTSRTQPKAIQYIQHADEIVSALDKLGAQKLSSIYHSLTAIKLGPHTPLLTVGAWVFMESLTAKIGREANTSFPVFFKKHKLDESGLMQGKGASAIHVALDRLSKSGNITKHNQTAAAFNPEQLANDMATLTPLILKCIEKAETIKTKT